MKKWKDSNIEDKVETLHWWILFIIFGLMVQGIAELLRLLLTW